ncbi:receptor-type tyrosine-protein phosphatase V-like isoform X2 [Hemicordylus capensis]|uniref:receptor-type tyrosine-protein phosphatase V-like isoform X2 n=1 Tax=Hemicordylus capensis TaxID=884348 RepID=UPI0023028DB5|nr:receptor-type tyrosine-protein phosphatase V-like isoform X2 [Hemicordylus capensis]
MLLLLLLLPMVWAPLLLAHLQTLAKDDRCNETNWQRNSTTEEVSDENEHFLNVSVSNQGRSDSLFLTWDKLLGEVQGFSLALYDLETDTLLQDGSAGQNATSFSFQGLLPGTRYSTKVTALLGCARNSTKRITGQTVPSPVRDVILNSHGSFSVLLASWSEAPGAKDGYQLILYHIDSKAVVRNVTVSKDATTFRFERLLAGSEYALRITTLAGYFMASTSARQWTAPIGPKTLTFQGGNSVSSLIASWANTGGAEWLRFTLHNLHTPAESTTVSVRSSLSNYTFQHLQPGTPYHLEVTATAGPYQIEGPSATAYTNPLKPTNVSLINYDRNNTLKAAWHSPAGGRESYQVILQSGESGTPVRNMSVGRNGTHVIFRSLRPGNHYIAWVTAIAGPHTASTKSTSAWTYPTAPTGGRLLSQGNAHTLQAYWKEVAGTGYVTALYTVEPLMLVQNNSVPKGKSSLAYEGLRPGTHYAWEICAVAGPHISLPLRLSNWTYPLPPEHLRLSNEGNSTRSLYASWQNPSGGRGHYVGTLLETKSQMVIKNMTIAKDWTNVSFERLVPGRQYTLQMVVAAGPYQSIVRRASDWTYPLAPLRVTLATSKWPSSLIASWDPAPGDREQFFLRFYSQEHRLLRNITIGPSMQNFTFQQLLSGSQYFLEVTALAGPYRASSQVVSAWTYPLSLANVSVKSGQNPRQLIVNWMESGSGREYWVQLYSDESLSAIRNVSVPHGTTQVTLDGLVPGMRYRVEIVSRAGPHHISSQTAIGYTVPSMPLSLVVNSHGSSVLTVQWKAPPGQRDSYMVSVSEEGSAAIRSHMPVVKSSTNITVVGLTPGTCYLIAVWSLAGPYSSASRNSTGCTAPAAPVNLTLRNTGNPSVLYTAWAEPPGGRDHYRIILYSLEPPGTERIQVVGPGTQDFIWTGLPAGSQFAVQIITVKGKAEASSTTIVEWTHPLPATSVQVWNEKYPGRLNVAWVPASGRLDSYELNLYHSGSGTMASQAFLGRDATNFTFSNLIPGAKYMFEIISKAGPYGTSAGNFSDWTSPLPPNMVQLSNKGNTDKLSASWEPTKGEQDGYALTLYYAGSGTVAAKTSVKKDATNFTFMRLMPGSKYLLEVASMAGPYQTSAANVSDWTYPLVPGKLSIMLEKNSRELSVSWGKPLSKPERCQLQLWHAGNSTGLRHHVLAQWQVQHVFQELVPGRNYSVSLHCIAGPYKNSSETVAIPVEPTRVKDLQCLPDTTSIFLNWTISEGDIEAFDVAVKKFPKDFKPSMFPLAVSRAEATLAELTSNTSYEINVSAVGSNSMRGPPVTVLCNTSVEVFPPPVRADIPQFDASSRVIISPDMFSEENGLIEYYGVVVTTNESLLRPTQDIIYRTWYDHYYGQEDSYLAVLVPNPFHLNESTNRKAWPVTVGTEECSHSRQTCNGKLKTDAQYRFSIAAFTRYSQKAPKVSFTAFSASDASADSAALSAPVVAGIIMGFLVTVTAISAWVYWKHLRARRMEKGSMPQEMTTYSLRNTHRPIPIQSFRQYYETRAANSNHGFFQDFEELKEVGKDQPKTEAELPANTSKNRYLHVLPYDYSRVKLSLLDGEPHSDYINANFVPGYNSPQEFIVTQGPLKKTLDDFWRLVWEQHICTIVMLTVGMENGRVLCEYYWPSDTSFISSGQFRIHLLAQNFADEWTTRELKLQHEGLNVERRVIHLHYTAWPDHGIPESTVSIMNFMELVRAHTQSAKESGPTLVHCSAGVGRSGTFIALDRLLQQLKYEKLVDVFNTIYSLRMSRHLMIQTLGQYIFLHSCILEKISEDPLIGLPGIELSHPIPLKSFVQHHARNCSKANAGFLREHEMLLEIAKEEVSSPVSPSGNQQVNLCSSKIPYDRSKVKFSPLGRDPFSDLAHVWFIPGYHSPKDYIAIEGPDKLSLDEFWGLVWEHGVHTIITLQPGQTNSPVPDNSCWPSEGEPVCTEMLTIQQGPEKAVSGWPCIQLRMKYEKKAKERLLQRFLFPLWEGEELPDSEVLMGFISIVRQLLPYRKKTSPLVLHCSSGGVAQMGILIALDTLLQQLKGEKSVDVYGVVLRLVRSCCLMTPTLDKYMYLYNCIHDIIAQKQV